MAVSPLRPARYEQNHCVGERVVKLMLQLFLRTMLALALISGPSLPAAAADLGSRPPAADIPALDAEAVAGRIESYLHRRGALLALRARFQVIDAADIPAQLERDMAALQGKAPSDWLEAGLEQDLAAEIGYFMVSLRYLVESGGPLWPADRPEADYVNDALVLLDGVKAAWLPTIESHADPLPLLEQLERVHWWTEGEVAPPEGEDAFAGVPAMVDAVLALAGPRANT